MFRRPQQQTHAQYPYGAPRRSPLAISLEPRMMFDGAVAATVADTAAEPPTQDAQAAPSSAAPETTRQEVVFIDSRLENYQQLLQAAQTSGQEAVVLAAGQDGLQQIADFLQGRSGIDAIHIFSHGQDGQLRLGSTTLDNSNIAHHEATLARIGATLDSEGDILFYGCEVAAGQAGRDLIQQIATLTQADIAASSDDTGASALGGDWVLEYRVGAIESDASLDQEALASYDGLLALPSSTQSFSDTYWNNNTGGNTVDGFSLNESTGATRASSPNSIYFDTAVVKDDPGVAGNYYYELTWTADGVDLGKFDLDGMVIQSFGGNYRLDFTATSGGAPVSQSFTYNGAQGPLTVDLNVALFNDISAFTVRVTNLSGAPSVANMDLQQVILADLKGPNTAPTVGNLNGDSVSFIEGGSATLLDSGSNATVADSDSANFDGGNVTASITANRVSGEDVLSIRNEGTGAGQIGVSGANVTYGGTIIGSYSGGTGTNDLVVTLNGNATPAAAQALMRNLTYSNSNTSDPSTSTRTVSITVNDGDGDTSTAANVSVGVTGVNDAPTLSATGGSPTYTENGAAVDLFSGVSISTVEAGQTITGVTLTVSNLADGASEIFRVDGTDIVLTNGTSGTTTGGNAIGYSVSVVGSTATVTLTKAGGLSAATAQTVVDGMSYRNASEAPSAGNRVVTLTSLTDNGGTANSGADSTVVSIAATVGVTSVNDAPVITAPGSISVTEDVASALTGISFADADAASATVTVTLSVGSGSLAATSGGNVTVAGSGTGSLTLTGSIADINAFIAASGASFTTAANATGNVTLTVDIDDGGNTGTDPGNSGTGSSEADSTTVTLNVTAVNDAPVVNVPASIGVTEDVGSALTGISFSDLDAGGSSVTATLSVASGALAAASGGGVAVGGSSSALTLTGTVANVNAFIAASNVTFTTASNATGDVTLTVSINDGGNTGSGGAQSDSDTTTLQVSAVNDAPVVAAPLSINVTEDVSTTLTGISFTDVDAGSASVTATFSVGSGILSATSGGGVTVSGSGTGTLTLTGSIVDINAFIAASGASFTTAANATGNVTLTVDIDDGGNTGTDPGNSGTGSSEADSTTVTLNVTAVNDAPVNAVPSAQAVDQDATLVFSGGNGNQISISDVDAGGGTVRVTLTASNGLITLSGTTGLSFIAGSGSNDGTMTFEGTIADINLALNGLTFSPTGGYNGAANLQIVTSDLGLSGSGGAQTDTDNIAITVNSLNPQVTDVQVTNPDGGYKVGDIITVTLSFSEAVIVNTGGGSPTLLLETGTTDRLASYVSGSGSNTLTFSYTVQAGDISADLDYQSTGALALNGATIRNAASDDAVLTLPANGGANSIAGQHAIVIDGVAPAVGSVSVPANGTYVAGQNLDFTVNYSETMLVDTGSGTPRLAITLDTGGTVYASYLSGSGSSALVFRYTVQSGQLDGNGISVGGALDLNGGTLRDAVGNDASTTLNSVGATGAVLVDAVAPTVASVAVPGNGSYNAGDVLGFTVNTSEAVIVNTGGGTPRFAVDIGGVTRYATYVSGTGTTALVFQYSVQAGDTDADGIAVGGTLDLNGGTTRDAAGNSLNLTLNSVGSTSGVLIDTSAPTPAGLVRVDSTPTGADSLRYTLTFNEAVTGVDTSDFTLVGTGTVSGAIQSVVQLDAQTYEVTVGSITGDGTLRLDLNAAGTGITDQAGNSVSVGLNGEVYTLDNTAPTVVAVTVPGDAVYVAGQALVFTVTFDDSVTVDTTGGAPRIAITLDSGDTVFADYLGGSGGNTLTFSYTVQPGQIDLTGVALATAIQPNGASLRDSLGNDASLALLSLPSTAGVRINAPAPLDAGDPEFRVASSSSGSSISPTQLQPTVPVAVMQPTSPLLPPTLFEAPEIGGGIKNLGSIFVRNGALAPSFIAQVFASNNAGDDLASGFLGFGGGDASIFGSSTLAGIFAETHQGVGEQEPILDREQWRRGAPSLSQQLHDMQHQEELQIAELAQALRALHVQADG